MVTRARTATKANPDRFHVRLRDIEETFWWSYNVPAKSHGHAVELAKLHMGWGNCHCVASVKKLAIRNR
jgi:hypothetical protein